MDGKRHSIQKVDGQYKVVQGGMDERRHSVERREVTRSSLDKKRHSIQKVDGEYKVVPGSMLEHRHSLGRQSPERR